MFGFGRRVKDIKKSQNLVNQSTEASGTLAGSPQILLETASCGLCGGTHRKVIYRCADFRLRRPSPQYGVCRCLACGFCYLSPRPAPQSVHLCYPDDYDKSRGSEDLSASRRYDAQANFLGHGKGSLLDVGGASGAFLGYADRLGWQTSAIDPLARAGSNARVRKLSVFADELAPGSFDAICAWHVVEHVYRPLEFFHRVSELLRPGGRFVLSVPNFDSYMSRWVRAEDVPRHVNFFSLRSLRRFGELAGLTATRHSFNSALAVGAEGRGAFSRWLFTSFAGFSQYDYLVARSAPGGLVAAASPALRLVLRPFNWAERLLLDPRRLERSGRMGVVAVDFRKD
jgi:SAM-dependent methyltransferase